MELRLKNCEVVTEVLPISLVNNLNPIHIANKYFENIFPVQQVLKRTLKIFIAPVKMKLEKDFLLKEIKIKIILFKSRHQG